MALSTTLARYRMTVALAGGLLGPAIIGTLFGFAGMTSATEIETLTTLIVWFVGVWALGAAGWELYSGYTRMRGSDSEEAVNDPATL